MEVSHTDILVDKIIAMTKNPANIIARSDATKNYIRLASREAEKLFQSGHKEEAGSIWLAIAPYYDLLRI